MQAGKRSALCMQIFYAYKSGKSDWDQTVDSQCLRLKIIEIR